MRPSYCRHLQPCRHAFMPHIKHSRSLSVPDIKIEKRCEIRFCKIIFKKNLNNFGFAKIFAIRPNFITLNLVFENYLLFLLWNLTDSTMKILGVRRSCGVTFENLKCWDFSGVTRGGPLNMSNSFFAKNYVTTLW